MFKYTTLTIFILFIGINLSFGQRKVLIEQFTNSGCPPCAGNTPVVASYINSHPNDFLMLSYHTSFPYQDSMYYENAIQSTHRVTFYSIPSVPYSVVDGNYFLGNLVPTISTTLTSASSVLPRYNISFSTSTRIGNSISTNLIFESTDTSNSGESLRAMVVLAEKNVLKSAYTCCAGNNSEVEYPWVVRRMLPDENGTILNNTIQGGVDNVNISYTTTNYKDLNELRIIAFVQNTVTKEVYQSEISTPVTATGITELTNSSNDLFQLIQSNIDNSLSVKIKNESKNFNIKILNSLGSEIYSSNSKSNEFTLSTANYKSGIYLIQVDGGNSTQTKKFIVNH